MASLAAWLMAVIAPIGKQLLVALGFGIVTYTGVDVAFNAMVASLSSQVSSIPPNVLVYAKISGVFEAMGLVLAAISFKISFMTLTKLARI